MYWRGKRATAGYHDFPDILTATSNYIGHIGKSNQVWRRLNQLRIWDYLLDISNCRGNCIESTICFPCKIQCDTSGLADTDQGIITTSLTQSLNQLIHIAFRNWKAELQCELISLSSPNPPFDLLRLSAGRPRNCLRLAVTGERDFLGSWACSKYSRYKTRRTGKYPGYRGSTFSPRRATRLSRSASPWTPHA